MMECCNCVYKSDALSEKEKMVRGISYSLLLSMVWIPFYADPENIQKITSYKVLLTTFFSEPSGCFIIRNFYWMC